MWWQLLLEITFRKCTESSGSPCTVYPLFDTVSRQTSVKCVHRAKRNTHIFPSLAFYCSPRASPPLSQTHTYTPHEIVAYKHLQSNGRVYGPFFMSHAYMGHYQFPFEFGRRVTTLSGV